MWLESTHATISSLIERREWNALRDHLEGWPPDDVVEALRHCEKPERVLVFRALPRDLAARVFRHLRPTERDTLLRELTDGETRDLLASLRPDDRTALLEELPGAVLQRLLGLLSPEDLAEARHLLGYPEQSVGRLMTPDYVGLHPDWTIDQALDHIKVAGRDSETLDHLYVVSDDGWLLGEARLRQLVLAERDTRVEHLMNRHVTSLSAFDDREEAVRTMKRADQAVLPVTDSGPYLLGIVTADDVLDVAEAEDTEDVLKQAGAPSEDDDAVEDASITPAAMLRLLRSRLPWLFIALIGGLLAGLVMGTFEETLQAVVALAFFVPLIMDMGGNVDTQASTIFVRSVTLGKVGSGNIAGHLAREALLGLIVGVIIGTLAGGAAFAWQGSSSLSLVIFLSMTAVCALASLIGNGIPWIAHKLGFDPATASDPFITTIKDVTALLIYFGLATWLLSSIN